MAISFGSIPNVLLTPGAYIEYDNSRAVRGLAPLPNKVILIGSMLDTGTALPGVLKPITRESDGGSYFGLGSQLDWMCEKFKKANKFVEVWAVGLEDDGAAVAATKTLTVTGTATSSGTLHILVHGERVPVGVAIDDDPTTIAAAIAAAVTAKTRLMYSAASAVGVATLTCKHAAAFGNDLDVRLNYFEREDLEAPAGVTVVIADGVTGTANPDAVDAHVAIGDEFFSQYAYGYNDEANILAAEAELAERWGPMVQQDGHAWFGLVGTNNEHTTIGDGRNSQFSHILGAGLSPAPPWEVVAVTVAVSAGEPDPGRPRQTLPLPNILPPAREDRFTLSERNLLLQAGISTFKADDGGRVLIERLITTYKTNAASLPDASYRNHNTMLLLAALRFTTRARIAQKYPRHKLADDDTNYGAGQAVVTPSVIRAELLTLFQEWEERAWVQNFKQFASELIVERNADDRDRLDVLLGPNLINQFRVFAAQIQFLL